MLKRKCPVCFRRIDKTARGNIAGHMETMGRPCPGSFQPHDIALADDRPEYKMTASDIREFWCDEPRKRSAS